MGEYQPVPPLEGYRRIICLANSLKLEERCIAGIDVDTGTWVRPVCDILYPEDGRIPAHVRWLQVGDTKREPELLDILEIPLGATGNNFGFERENLSVMSGEWRCLGKATPASLIPYCCTEPLVLHNHRRSVEYAYLKSLSHPQRSTLQLVRAQNVTWRLERGEASDQKSSKKPSWKADITTAYRQTLADINVTDPFWIARLEAGPPPTATNYLLTISLSMPWQRPDRPTEPLSCWKLVAGIIEL